MSLSVKPVICPHEAERKVILIMGEQLTKEKSRFWETVTENRTYKNVLNSRIFFLKQIKNKIL